MMRFNFCFLKVSAYYSHHATLLLRVNFVRLKNWWHVSHSIGMMRECEPPEADCLAVTKSYKIRR